MEYSINVSKEQVLKVLGNNITLPELFAIIDNVSDAYSSIFVDQEIAAHCIQKLGTSHLSEKNKKKEWVNEVLKPLRERNQIADLNEDIKACLANYYPLDRQFIVASILKEHLKDENCSLFQAILEVHHDGTERGKIINKDKVKKIEAKLDAIKSLVS